MTDKPSFRHSRASVRGGGDPVVICRKRVMLSVFGGGWMLRDGAENVVTWRMATCSGDRGSM